MWFLAISCTGMPQIECHIMISGWVLVILFGNPSGSLRIETTDGEGSVFSHSKNGLLTLLPAYYMTK
jgi:hypothetical protein